MVRQEKGGGLYQHPNIKWKWMRKKNTIYQIAYICKTKVEMIFFLFE